MNDNEIKYISVREAAVRVGVSKDTMFKLAKQDGFPCVKIGRRYVIHKDRLDEWMQGHEGREVVVK